MILRIFMKRIFLSDLSKCFHIEIVVPSSKALPFTRYQEAKGDTYLATIHWKHLAGTAMKTHHCQYSSSFGQREEENLITDATHLSVRHATAQDALEPSQE
jgi:hypothetical protein